MRNLDDAPVEGPNTCQILFQNPHFVAVEKPNGWLSTPAREGERDPRPVLGRIVENQLGQRIFPIHRLDFEASGVVLMGLSSESHRAANSWFENRQVQKTYEALTTLREAPELPLGEWFDWRCFLQRGKKRVFESPHGKESVTRARVIKKISHHRGSVLAWELEPLTGRPHQLRFELARHGCPILGDQLYGSTVPFREGQPAIALHARRLKFLSSDASLKWGLPEIIESPIRLF